jgi:hypothetical protein
MALDPTMLATVAPTNLNDLADPMDHPKVKAYITNLRGESAATRVELDTLKAAETERQRLLAVEQGNYQELLATSERDRNKDTAKHTAELGKLQGRIISGELRTVAGELGVLPDALDKLEKFIDLSKITLDDDGKTVGAREQIEALKTEMPFLFTPEGGTTIPVPVRAPVIPPRAAPVATTELKKAADMSAAEYEAAWGGLGKKT